MNGEELAVAARVGACFEGVGVAWQIGGSIASSVVGVPRATNDVDVVAALSMAHAEPFVRSLGSGFYVDLDAVRDAIRRGRSFNTIEHETVTKVDVFIASPGSTATRALARRVWLDVSGPAGGLRLPFASPADIVVEKLAWFDKGGRTSERQWRDVIGVLRVRALPIDDELLDALAAERGVSELLARGSRRLTGARSRSRRRGLRRSGLAERRWGSRRSAWAVGLYVARLRSGRPSLRSEGSCGRRLLADRVGAVGRSWLAGGRGAGYPQPHQAFATTLPSIQPMMA